MKLRFAFPIVGGLVLGLAAGLLVSGGAARAAIPSAPAASEAALITVVGTGVVPGTLDFSSFPQWVNVNIQTQNTDAQRAVADAQAKIASLRAAAEKAGLPATAIRITGLNVFPQMGANPGEKQPAPQPRDGAPSSGYTVMASVQIDTVGAKQLEAALSVAMASGAVNVNASYGKGAMPGSPEPSVLASAISDAIAQAGGYAEVAAKASGKRLGPVHSISVTQATPDCCPPANGWRVQVTVSYEVAP